jgi:hypothetical protein
MMGKKDENKDSPWSHKNILSPNIERDMCHGA